MHPEISQRGGLKCTESEETEKFFESLLLERVGVLVDEEFLISEEEVRSE